MISQDDIANANATYHGFMRGVKIGAAIIGIATLIVVLIIASHSGATPA